MKNIALITDTNSSIPNEIASQYEITKIPILIQFGEESYTTGVDIDDGKLFEMIDDRKVLPTTAAPAPSAFQEAFQKAFQGGADGVICVCCSSKVSATYNAALLAAEEFPGKDISVVDSLQLTLGEGFQVLGAAEALAAGATKEEALQVIEDIRSNTHVYAALPTLKYLAMGGRMGKLAAGLADTISIKPILTIQDGKLELLEKIRTWGKARQRLVHLAEVCTQGKTIKRIGLPHVNNPDGAATLFEDLKEALSITQEPLISEFSPGLSVHSGAGFIGYVIITD
jgi:DegV family protein with EDD domain